jgi:hypothetical protein
MQQLFIFINSLPFNGTIVSEEHPDVGELIPKLIPGKKEK